MSNHSRFLRSLAAGLFVASLMAPVNAAAQNNDDDELLMMAFMGGGFEGPIDGTAAMLSAVLALPTVSASDSASFSRIDFPQATTTRAFSINAVGDIVGSYTEAGVTHGYLLSQGRFVSIDVPGSTFTEVWGINPRGDMIGRYRLPGDGTSRTRGFLLSDGVFSDVSVGTHRHTLPTGINANGDIVGCFHDTNFLEDMRGYRQRGESIEQFVGPSTMHNGSAPGGGTVVGISFASTTTVSSYIIAGNVVSYFSYPGATFTQAWDVNPSGTVVGYYNATDSHGFVLDRDGLRSIDVPDAVWTRIFGINPQGDMVGAYADANNQIHGFVRRARNER